MIYPNVQPICNHPQHGGLESGLPPNLRLCVNPEHRNDKRNWWRPAGDGSCNNFRPVWHRIADWPKEGK